MAQDQFISQTSADKQGFYTVTMQKPDGTRHTVRMNVFGANWKLFV